jgi:hypothetical protein
MTKPTMALAVLVLVLTLPAHAAQTLQADGANDQR